MATYDAGIVTAYGAAVRGGYTGTYEDFCAQQANYASTAAAVAQAKADAEAAATAAQTAAASLTVDSAMSNSSTNPVQNKVIYGELSDLKDDLNYSLTLSNDGKEWILGNWIIGTIVRANGNYYLGSYKYRIATPDFVVFSKSTTYTIASGFILQVYIFDSDGVLTANPIDYTGTYTAPANTKLRFTIMRSVEDTSETANVAEFRSKVYKSNSVQDKLDNAITKENLKPEVSNLFAPIAKLSKNEFDTSKLILGKRYKYSDGVMVADANYNVFPLTIPNGKMAVVTCIYEQGSARQYVRSCRFLTVLTTSGEYVTSSNSDTASSVYTNNTGADVIAYFTCYALTTKGDYYMVQIFDAGTATSAYVTDYVPFGFEFLTDDGKAYLQNTDFVVSPRVQAYFEDEVDDTVGKVLELIKKPCITFAFITDTHLLPNNENSKRWTRDTFSNLNAVCSRIPVLKVCHGGDYVRSGWTHTTQAEVNVYINKIRMMMVASGQKVFAVNGNHDGINGAPPAETLYNCLMSHNVEYVDRVSDNPYFYEDDDKNKVRFIFLANPLLGTYGIPTTELTWLTSTLASVPSGYDVILVSHIDPSCSDFTTNKTEFCTLLNSWHNHTGDYTANTGKIIAMVAGHRHFDWTVPTSQSGLDFPVVVCTCSYPSYITPSTAEANSGAVNVNVRTDKTVLQDSWSVFVYRPDEDKLYLIRFGAGNDRTIDLSAWNTSA